MTMKKFTLFLCIGALLSACQSITPKNPNTAHNTATVLDVDKPSPLVFAITGKISISAQSAHQTQTTSAFYAWGQDDTRFAIDLTGAMGLGAASIRYDGTQAILEQGDTTKSAQDPESLLFELTGVRAPLASLPYWILGKTAPSDQNPQYNLSHQLTQIQNSAWTATLEYQGALPSRLKITHPDGHRIIMTIQHAQL